MTRRLALVCALLGAACRINDIDVNGKACPCPEDWNCSPVTNTCTKDFVPTDGSRPDIGDTKVSSYRQAVVDDLPLAYWRFDDLDKIANDEMGHFPGTYTDSCTKGIPGALVGDPSTAVNFDGTSCHIVLPAGLGFTGTLPYTVEAWIQEPLAVSGFRVIFSKTKRAAGPIDGYDLADSATGVYFERAVAGTAPTTPHLSHPFGSYVHLVGVYDGAQIVMYINDVVGSAVADVRPMPVVDAIPLIGADSAGDYFKGAIDEIAIYDHVLAPERVKLHYNLATTGSP